MERPRPPITFTIKCTCHPNRPKPLPNRFTPYASPSPSNKPEHNANCPFFRSLNSGYPLPQPPTSSITPPQTRSNVAANRSTVPNLDTQLNEFDSVLRQVIARTSQMTGAAHLRNTSVTRPPPQAPKITNNSTTIPWASILVPVSTSRAASTMATLRAAASTMATSRAALTMAASTMATSRAASTIATLRAAASTMATSRAALTMAASTMATSRAASTIATSTAATNSTSSNRTPPALPEPMRAQTISKIQQELEKEARRFETLGRIQRPPEVRPPSATATIDRVRLGVVSGSGGGARVMTVAGGGVRIQPLTLRMKLPDNSKSNPAPIKSSEDDGSECIICLENKKSHILIPCGHYSYCEGCAKNMKTCALCRKKVTKRVKVFES